MYVVDTLSSVFTASRQRVFRVFFSWVFKEEKCGDRSEEYLFSTGRRCAHAARENATERARALARNATRGSSRRVARPARFSRSFRSEWQSCQTFRRWHGSGFGNWTRRETGNQEEFDDSLDMSVTGHHRSSVTDLLDSLNCQLPGSDSDAIMDFAEIAHRGEVRRSRI